MAIPVCARLVFAVSMDSRREARLRSEEAATGVIEPRFVLAAPAGTENLGSRVRGEVVAGDLRSAVGGKEAAPSVLASKCKHFAGFQRF